MGWRQHLSCKIEVKVKGATKVWETPLPVPAEIPLAELFAHNIPGRTKHLRLEERRVLWTYANINDRVWTKATQELAQWLSHLEADHKKPLTIDAHGAGAAVLLNLLNHKPKFKLHVRVHHAPLTWLSEQFTKVKSKKHRFEQVAYENCPWSARTEKRKRLAA